MRCVRISVCSALMNLRYNFTRRAREAKTTLHAFITSIALITSIAILNEKYCMYCIAYRRPVTAFIIYKQRRKGRVSLCQVTGGPRV